MRTSLALVSVLVVVAASCSSSDDAPPAASDTPIETAASTTSAPTVPTVPPTTVPPTTVPPTTVPPPTAPPTTVAPTTAPPSAEPDAASRRGPYAVGVATLQIPDGPMVEVWYPAAEGTTGTDTYDARDFVPEALRALLTGDASSTYTIDAGRDAEVASPPQGGFPIVASSHGFAAFRTVSSFLTSHLASWGMVVVAPDHPARDLSSQLGGGVDDPSDPVDDLVASIDLVLADERFADHLDPSRIAAIGHSAGGPTAVGFAGSDERVIGYAEMASGWGDDVAPPDVPSFHIAGALDAVIEADVSSRAAFETAAVPAIFWLVAEVGHQGFTDLCTYGDGTGVIGVAEASGLGPLLDTQPQFRRLGEDGCIPPAAPIELAHPIVLHGVTTWLVDLFSLDAGISTSLGPDAAAPYELAVTVESRP